MANQPRITLNNGQSLPLIGVGTFNAWQDDEKVAQSVYEALEIGYRAVDCAAMYRNESAIGAQIEKFLADHPSVSRSDLTITSKLWNDDHARKDVKPALLQTLKDLRTPYLDLFLIHWPVAFKKEAVVSEGSSGGATYKQPTGEVIDIPLFETWQAMEELVDEGLVKSIGLSNVSISQITDILSKCRIKPAIVQVESHPLLSQEKFYSFLKSHGIAMTAYSPLGKAGAKKATTDAPEILTHPEIVKIAEKLKKTSAQVVIKWQVQRGVAVIPKSMNPGRLRQNLEVDDFTLGEEDVKAIEALNINYRFVRTAWLKFDD